VRMAPRLGEHTHQVLRDACIEIPAEPAAALPGAPI